MDMANIRGLTVKAFKDNIKMIRDMEVVYLPGQMGINL